MADHSEPEDRLSPQEMRRWLSEELTDLSKALQLRAIEATSLVTAYSAGEISAEEAEKRLHQYDRRWGEALPGTSVSKGVTDEAILAAIDKATVLQNSGSFQRRLPTAQSKRSDESSR